MAPFQFSPSSPFFSFFSFFSLAVCSFVHEALNVGLFDLLSVCVYIYFFFLSFSFSFLFLHEKAGKGKYRRESECKVALGETAIIWDREEGRAVIHVNGRGD